MFVWKCVWLSDVLNATNLKIKPLQVINFCLFSRGRAAMYRFKFIVFYQKALVSWSVS